MTPNAAEILDALDGGEWMSVQMLLALRLAPPDAEAWREVAVTRLVEFDTIPLSDQLICRLSATAQRIGPCLPRQKVAA